MGKIEKIGILGAGAYGTALGTVLRRAGATVYFFDPVKYPERRLEDVLEFSDAVILVTPARVAEMTLAQFSPTARRKPLIVATKGLMGTEVYQGFSDVEIISGPGFASEIVAGKKFRLTVAKEGLETEMITVAERLFPREAVEFDRTGDVAGVAMLGGLKNIFAIEAGRRRLSRESEEFGEYIEDVIREAKKFLIYNGGFRETVELSAGRGDFVLTCGSEESRNYRFGKEILRKIGARKELPKDLVEKTARTSTVEGLFAVEEIRRRGLFVPKNAEILTDILRRIENATKR